MSFSSASRGRYKIRTCDPFRVREVRYLCANRPKRVSAYATCGCNAKSSACRPLEIDAGKCRTHVGECLTHARGVPDLCRKMPDLPVADSRGGCAVRSLAQNKEWTTGSEVHPLSGDASECRWPERNSRFAPAKGKRSDGLNYRIENPEIMREWAF